MRASFRTRCRLAAVTMVAAAGLWPAAALAGWTRSTGGWAAARTPTLAAPAGLTATCGGLLGLLSTAVKLDWTATPSTWADGYEIAWGTTDGGPYSGTDWVPATSLTWTSDELTGSLLGRRYYFVVRATSGSNWRSDPSNQTTKKITLLGCGN